MKTDTTFQPRHLYLLLAMIAATVAVVLSPHTHPVALVLLSAAILASGFAGAALHHALVGFFTGGRRSRAPLPSHARTALEHDKGLVLRAIKELEFDRAMGKVGDADFEEIGGRLRARAMTIMEDLERTPVDAPPPRVAGSRGAAARGARASDSSPAAAERRCGSCGDPVDTTAKFCPHCGARL